MWRKYFGAQATIIGADLDPRCKLYEEEGIHVETLDQSDPDMLEQLVNKYGDFDIIIDDGSHRCDHQMVSLLFLWPALNPGGVYLVEDTHTSYRSAYQGGVRARTSFVEFAKDRVDDINAFWSLDTESLQVNRFTKEMLAVSFFDSMVVFEKRITEAKEPVRLLVGTPSRELVNVVMQQYADTPDQIKALWGEEMWARLKRKA